MGPAGAGKSTVAEYLERQYGAKRYSFARPLKEIARRTLDFTEAQVYGTQAEKESVDNRFGFSPRWFLQRLGTEGVRAVLGESFWTDYCIESILESAPDVAVIDDVRFPNEARAIQAEGGKVLRLECPDRRTAADAAHVSEAAYLRAPYDALVRPAVRGVDLLCSMVRWIVEGWLG
jgi:hypothetical protein